MIFLKAFFLGGSNDRANNRANIDSPLQGDMDSVALLSGLLPAIRRMPLVMYY